MAQHDTKAHHGTQHGSTTTPQNAKGDSTTHSNTPQRDARRTAQTKPAPNSTTHSATQHCRNRERTQTNTTSKAKRTSGHHGTAPHSNTAPQNTGHSTGERDATTNQSTQQGSKPRGQAGASATKKARGKQQRPTRPCNKHPATTGNNTWHRPARRKQTATTSKKRRRQQHITRQAAQQNNTAPHPRTEHKPQATTGDQATAPGGNRRGRGQGKRTAERGPTTRRQRAREQHTPHHTTQQCRTAPHTTKHSTKQHSTTGEATPTGDRQQQNQQHSSTTPHTERHQHHTAPKNGREPHKPAHSRPWHHRARHETQQDRGSHRRGGGHSPSTQHTHHTQGRKKNTKTNKEREGGGADSHKAQRPRAPRGRKQRKTRDKKKRVNEPFEKVFMRTPPILGALNPKNMAAQSEKLLFGYSLSKVTFWPVESWVRWAPETKTRNKEKGGAERTKSAKAHGTQGREAQKAGDSQGARGEKKRGGKKKKKKTEARASPARRRPDKQEGQNGQKKRGGAQERAVRPGRPGWARRACMSTHAWDRGVASFDPRGEVSAST